MRTSSIVALAAVLLLRVASAQGEVRLRLAAGPATGEPRLALHTDLEATAAAQQLDAVLPSPGQAATAAPFVAANLFDTASRARAGAARVLFDAAGTRILVTGIVDPAHAGAGRVADEPAAKLREALAGADAQVVVVLTDLDRKAALQLLRDVPQATLVLQRAGALADRAPAELDGRFVMPWPDDDVARRLVATLQDGRLKAPRLELLTADPAQAAAPLQQLLQGASPPQPEPVAAHVARSRAVELQVHAIRVADGYGDRVGACVVVDAEFANIMPLEFVYDRQIPVAWQVPKLQDHVYLVVGGTRLLQLSADADALPGHLPAPKFQLDRLGEHKRGNLVFPLPAGLRPGADTALELRVYDFAHGHLLLQLAGTPPAAAAPVSPLQHNEVVELGAFGVERRAELGGSKAPDGMVFVVVDLRACSTFRIDADATAFDPKAKRGQRLQIGTVADWTDSRRYLQLVADGVFGFPPAEVEPAEALPPAPRFLPDLPTGGMVAFLVPAAATSLQLRCDFPNAKSSLDGKLMRPKGFTVALAGEPPALPELPALVSAKDSQFEVRLLRQEAVAAHGGEPAGDGQRFLLCDLEVRNVGKDGEFFQTKAQLQLATADGKLHPIDPVAARGPAPAFELLWVPPAERRRCTAVYRIAGKADRLRLCYASVDAGGARMLPLPPLPAAAVPVAETPIDKPQQPPEPEMTPAPQPPAVAAPPQPTDKPATAPQQAPPPQPPAAATTPQQPDKPAQPAAPALADILKPPHAPKGIEGVGLTAEQVNRAIDRGADALWHYIRTVDMEKHRVRFGDAQEHLLSALALVHADAHKRHADFDRTLRTWLAGVDPSSFTMYRSGLLAMLVEAYGDPAFVEAQRLAVRSILETQGKDGTWTYSRNLEPGLFAAPDADQALRVTGGIPLEGDGPAPMARISDWSVGQDGDNSVSQYSLLGLLAAERSGTPIVADVWRRAAAGFRDRQCDDGGWEYHGKSYRGYGSMTCAGICSLAIALHEQDRDPRQDDAVLKGLAWLDANFAVDKHPRRSTPTEWLYYYLYSLERVGRILDLEFIGRYEWYPLGARFLLAAQRSDGTWKGEWTEDDVRVAGSFALLFLTRATATLKPRELARGGNGWLKTGVRLPPGGRYYIILDASGSMLEQRDGKSKWQIARDAVDHLVQELPDSSEVALRVYGHRKSALEPDASDDTELVVPMRRLDKKAFAQKLQALRARGKTPLARSLLEAARDLGGATAKEPVTLVLLTDGGEDSLPRQDPVAAAAAIGKLVAAPRSAVKFFLIGFDIGRDDWLKQLAAMTAAGGGTYCPAQQAGQLDTGLRSAVLGVPEVFVVQDRNGAERGRGAFGATLELPEGRYSLATTWAGRSTETSLWINTGRVTGVTFDARPLQQQPAAPSTATPIAPPGPPAVAPQPPTDPSPATPKFCTGCGKPLPAGAKFCPGCGAKVGG